MNVGVDLTDEGYYLNWISNPWLYKYYVSQFGYIYHPVYQLLGNDLVLLRFFNALLSYVLGFVLIYLILKRSTHQQNKDFLVMSSASIALPSLFILMITGHWVPSPSYNSLCFQGLLITMIGMVLSCSSMKYSQFHAAFFIGLGGWLVFMAKPSSALLLSLVVPLYFAFEFKKYMRLLLGAAVVALCLVLLTGLYVDGSIVQFINRYQIGLHLLDIMGSKHGINNFLRLDPFTVSMADQYKFLLLTSLVAGVFFAIEKGSTQVKIILTTSLSVAIGIMLWLAFSRDGLRINTPRHHPLILLAVLFAAILFWLFVKTANKPSVSNLKLILLFLVLPYIYAAGSGNNYWETAAGGMLFWMIAALLILLRSSTKHAHTLVLAAVVASVTVKVMLDAQNSPYRQTESIAHQSHSHINPHTKKELLLPKDTAMYLNDLQHLLDKADFKENTPVIDFTGHHPGTLYFMQANAIGQAWTIGGYDGSNDMAALALNQATCHEIANSWLIIEKDGRRSVDYRVLEKHGIQADKNNYTKVGMVLTKKFTDWGFVNQSHPDGRYEQYLLKPNHPDIQEKNCLAFRQQHLNPRY
ncbi:MAG TPA: hypothetical protein PLP44_07790 [Methylophilus sp.]|nr:hypothetical protein [Methylophilus sp.]